METTDCGRSPCFDCCLKHLGAASMAGFSKGLPAYALLHVRRCQTLMAEAATGDFRHHRHYAAGIVVMLEEQLYVKCLADEMNEARKIRKRMVADTVLDEGGMAVLAHLAGMSGTLRMDPTAAMAHLVEAWGECPDKGIADAIHKWINGDRSSPPPIDEWIMRLDAMKEVEDGKDVEVDE